MRGDFFQYTFEATPKGVILSDAKAIIFWVLLAGLFTIFVMFVNATGKNSDYGWTVGYLLGAYVTALITAFLSWYISENYIYELPLLSEFLNIVWIVLAILLPIILILLAFSLLREQAEELMVKKKMKYGYTREEIRK